jgi:large subunit ribosomal protein L17
MRHRKTLKTLGRTSAHRKATMANLCSALIENKHIQTTEAKARVTRRLTEKLITLAKQGTLHARRIALQRIRQKHAVKILFDEIAPRFADRKGGYTRLVKLGRRFGDGAPMAVVELIGFEMAVKKQKDKQAKAEAKEKKEAKKGKGSEKPKTEEHPKETKRAKPGKEVKTDKAGKEAKKESAKESKKETKKEPPKAAKEEKDKKKKESKDKKSGS